MALSVVVSVPYPLPKEISFVRAVGNVSHDKIDAFAQSARALPTLGTPMSSRHFNDLLAFTRSRVGSVEVSRQQLSFMEYTCDEEFLCSVHSKRDDMTRMSDGWLRSPTNAELQVVSEVVLPHVRDAADTRSLRILGEIVYRLVEQRPVSVCRLFSELVSATAQYPGNVTSSWPRYPDPDHALALTPLRSRRCHSVSMSSRKFGENS
jgi:hypothetical protein